MTVPNGGRPRITAARLIGEIGDCGIHPAEPQAALSARRTAYAAAAKPLIDDLAKLGYHVTLISDLRCEPLKRYRDAVPTLASWLTKIQDPTVKEDIARALAVPWARQAVPVLLDEFDSVEDSELRWAIGNSLEIFASDQLFNEFTSRSLNKHYGVGRRMLVLGLGKMRSNRNAAIEVLMTLIDDAEVSISAMIALGKLRAIEARPRIEEFLDDPSANVRKRAKLALAQIDKGDS